MDECYEKLKAICQYLIYRSRKDDLPLTSKKLQQILYYIQALNLHRNGREAFKVGFEAWIHGAIIPVVYSWYRGFGNKLLIRDNIDVESIKQLIDQETLAVVDDAWSKCSKLDVYYLEKINCHGQAWQNARQGLTKNDISIRKISLDAIVNNAPQELKALG